MASNPVSKHIDTILNDVSNIPSRGVRLSGLSSINITVAAQSDWQERWFSNYGLALKCGTSRLY